MTIPTTPINAEHLEKVRQEIMRFRELLNIMRLKLDEGERTYARLFATYLPNPPEGLKEKDRQGLLARHILETHDERTPLRDAVMKVRFDAHELERAFEEFYNLVATDLPADE